MFETLKASVYALLDEIIAQPEDPHALQERLREELQQMRALGQAMPQDLVALEHWLDDALSLPPETRPPMPAELSQRKT